MRVEAVGIAAGCSIAWNKDGESRPYISWNM